MKITTNSQTNGKTNQRANNAAGFHTDQAVTETESWDAVDHDLSAGAERTKQQEQRGRTKQQ